MKTEIDYESYYYSSQNEATELALKAESLEAENQRLRELVGEMLSAWDQTNYFDSDKYRRQFLKITA